MRLPSMNSQARFLPSFPIGEHIIPKEFANEESPYQRKRLIKNAELHSLNRILLKILTFMVLSINSSFR